MNEVSKARITFTNETTFSILILDGEWIYNPYEIPLREGVDKQGIIEVIVNDDGKAAHWAHPERFR